MDEEDEEQNTSGGAENPGTGSVPHTAFLFGNVNQEGELEDDGNILDEVSKRCLNNLNSLNAGVGEIVKEIATVEDTTAEETADSTTTHDPNEKAANAVDYFDMNEALAEEEVVNAMAAMKPPTQESSDDDYDGENVIQVSSSKNSDKSDHQVLWTPDSSAPAITTSSISSPITSTSSSSTSAHSQTKGLKGCSLSNPKSKYPFAGLLPEELQDINLKEMYPELKKGKECRFLRLFKPVHRTPMYWNKKKPKVENKEKEAKEKENENPKESGDGNRELLADVEKTDEVKDVNGKVEVNEESEDVDPYADYNPLRFNWGREPKPEELAEDDALAMLKEVRETTSKTGSSGELEDEELGPDKKPKIAEWRYGPAKLWYDMLGVDDSGEDFDYRLRNKKEAEAESVDAGGECIQRETSMPPASMQVDFPDDAYLMVTQKRWEDDIIWNPEDVKQEVMQSFKTKGAAAGWIPTDSTKTLNQYLQQTQGHTSQVLMSPQVKRNTPGTLDVSSANDATVDEPEKQWTSIFPAENEELVYGRWEDHIIWDAHDLSKIPKPSVLTIDPNDENIILSIPDDHDPEDIEEEQAARTTKEKKEMHISKQMLSKVGLIKDDEDGVQKEEEVRIRDPFNISNDEYYNPKKEASDSLHNNISRSVMHHSTPSMELRQPFFPTHLGPVKLRNFHRHALKQYSSGAMASPGPHPVLPLLTHIKRKQMMRDKERLASGGGDMFSMRTPDDLSGRDGDLILAEYSEEFPPLLMQVGMATMIKNFYKRKPGKDVSLPEFRYGELEYAHTSPFLGTMMPGQCIQAFENNMFRAPIYEHKMPNTDFLVIRSRQHFYIREVETIMTVGQQCPLQEVPGPNSKKANNFIKEFLQVFIYRLFWKSKDTPRRIKMEDIKKAFPSLPEASIRKGLKLCADFKRTGADCNWWVLKPEFRLLTEEEMRDKVSPEQCCGYYSMLAAEQRLKDAGYGGQSLFVSDDDNDDDNYNKMDEEVHAAPWNTTRAYIQAMKGKCLLALTGLADPTGCGEGFSYVKAPNKPQGGANKAAGKEMNTNPHKKTLTGTDADLRKLSLKDAKQLLERWGVPGHLIKKLKRWDVIDMVRTMSTQQAKAGQEGMTKFARGNRFSAAEQHERYKEECQRIYELQNRVLSSKEVLSTDEESSDEELDSDIEEMGKNLENMLSNKKTNSQISYEREEAERLKMKKMMHGKYTNTKDNNKKDQGPVHPGVKKLIITRTFRRDDGQLYTRSEEVRKPSVIKSYIKIRQSKDDGFIRQFTLNDRQKGELRKQRRRLQDQLRRTQRALDIQTNIFTDGSVISHPESPNLKPSNKKGKDQPQLKVDHNLITIQDTKLKFSKALIEQANRERQAEKRMAETMKQTLIKIPKKLQNSRKRQQAGTTLHCDYLKHQKTSSRRRADPVVTLSSIFEQIINEMRDIPGTQLFNAPVKTKHAPDYYNIIKNPMDLQTMREKARKRQYSSREPFLVDINQILENSNVYNGAKSVLTLAAQKMFNLCLQRLAEKEEKLMRLEKAINPLLDDDIVAFSYILTTIIEDRMKIVDGSHIFHKPVNKKLENYLDRVKKPMDLETLLKNVKSHKYKTVTDFLKDVELIANNSAKYNGETANVTDIARKMVQVCKDALKEHEEQLANLEKNIRNTTQDALDAAEADSFVTGTSQSATNDGMDVESMDGSIKPPKAKKRKTLPVTDRITIQNTPHEDEYVDIEGDDEEYRAEDSLVNDLLITPENSDEEDVPGPLSGRLSSNHSDLERETTYMDTTGYGQSANNFNVDDNAIDYSEYMTEEVSAPMDGQEHYTEKQAVEEGDSSDPYQNRGGVEGIGVDVGDQGIAADLELSDSEDDEEDDDDFDGGVEGEGAGVDVGDQGIAADLQLSDSDDDEEDDFEEVKQDDESNMESFDLEEFLQ